MSGVQTSAQTQRPFVVGRLYSGCHEVWSFLALSTSLHQQCGVWMTTGRLGSYAQRALYCIASQHGTGLGTRTALWEIVPP